jgi:hypothetical protein
MPHAERIPLSNLVRCRQVIINSELRWCQRACIQTMAECTMRNSQETEEIPSPKTPNTLIGRGRRLLDGVRLASIAFLFIIVMHT